MLRRVGIRRGAVDEAQDREREPVARTFPRDSTANAICELRVDEHELGADPRNVGSQVHGARFHPLVHRHGSSSARAAYPLHG